MRSAGDERREFQRLEIDPPLSGTLSGADVSILEVGVLGARVRHANPLDSSYAELRFAFDGDDIGLRCEVIRTSKPKETHDGSAALESGLRFTAALDDSGDKLRAMLARLVKREFEIRQRMPADSIRKSAVDGDKTVRGVDAGFLSYRLENGTWQKRHIFIPEQPPVGFTVGRAEDGAEMQRLCLVYEASDEEGRRLIRMFAELSVSDQLQIPPRG